MASPRGARRFPRYAGRSSRGSLSHSTLSRLSSTAFLDFRLIIIKGYAWTLTAKVVQSLKMGPPRAPATLP